MVSYSPPVGDDELPSYPYLSKDAAEYLATLPVKAFGTDAFSVESAVRMYEAIEKGATGLESVVFMGFPLKVQGSNGSPIRAAALVY